MGCKTIVESRGMMPTAPQSRSSFVIFAMWDYDWTFLFFTSSTLQKCFHVRVCITKKTYEIALWWQTRCFSWKFMKIKCKTTDKEIAIYLNNDLCIKYRQCEILQFMVIASWTVSLYKDCKCGFVLNWRITWKCVIYVDQLSVEIPHTNEPKYYQNNKQLAKIWTLNLSKKQESNKPNIPRV